MTRFSDQDRVTAAFDGVVSEQSVTVFAVGDEVIVLPGSVGRRGDDKLQGVKEGADLCWCVIGGTQFSLRSSRSLGNQQQQGPGDQMVWTPVVGCELPSQQRLSPWWPTQW